MSDGFIGLSVEGPLTLGREKTGRFRGVHRTVGIAGHRQFVSIIPCNDLTFKDSSEPQTGTITSADGRYYYGGEAAVVTFRGGTFHREMELFPDTLSKDCGWSEEEYQLVSSVRGAQVLLPEH